MTSLWFKTKVRFRFLSATLIETVKIHIEEKPKSMILGQFFHFQILVST